MKRSQIAAVSLVVAVIALLVVNPADAHAGVRWWYPSRYRRPNYGYGNSYANSMANLIRAQSQAALNYEQARGKYIENKQKWTQNYYKMREERQAHLAKAQAEGKHSIETMEAVAKSDIPPLLGSDVLDPVTGRITWPLVLQGADFAAQRTRLEQLFEMRATTGTGFGHVDQIHAAAMEMTSKLRNRITEIPAKQYIAGRKFLDSLDYTAQNPTG